MSEEVVEWFTMDVEELVNHAIEHGTVPKEVYVHPTVLEALTRHGSATTPQVISNSAGTIQVLPDSSVAAGAYVIHCWNPVTQAEVHYTSAEVFDSDE